MVSKFLHKEESIMLALSIVYIGILLIKSAFVLIYIRIFHKKFILRQDQEQQSTSIMQPILSGDAQLENVLERNIVENSTQNFLWLVDSDDIEGLQITASLKKRYSKINIQIVKCKACPNGLNPKIFKFQTGTKYLKTKTVIILDDDTFLPQKTLSYLLLGLEKFLIVTGLPCYLQGENISSKLLAQFVNNNSTMTYLSLNSFMKPVTINGMCYSLKVETIKKLDNFNAILNNLTDDLALAKSIKELGGDILQIPQVQFIQTSVKNIKHYFQLMHRWFFFAILLLKKESFLMNILIFLLLGVSPIILLTIMIGLVVNFSSFQFYTVIILLFARAIVLSLLQIKITQKSRHNFFLSIVSEFLQPFHLFHAVLINKIQWRKRKYRVKANDQFEQI